VKIRLDGDELVNTINRNEWRGKAAGTMVVSNGSVFFHCRNLA
jgi:hypothetical protein